MTMLEREKMGGNEKGYAVYVWSCIINVCTIMIEEMDMGRLAAQYLMGSSVFVQITMSW